MQDLTGMKFGRLTVDKFIGKNKHGHHIWRCYCSCYACPFVKVASCSLLSGGTKSCGCLNRENASNLSKKHGKNYIPPKGIKNRKISEANRMFYDYYKIDEEQIS